MKTRSIPFLALFCCLLLASRVCPAEEPSTNPLEVFIKTNAVPAVQFVVEKCREYPVVLIGEHHWIHQQVTFVKDVVGPVYSQAGVTNIILEFGSSDIQPAANQFLNAPQLDESSRALIYGILRSVDRPIGWGYREYYDLFEEIWNINRTRPQSQPPVTIWLANYETDIYAEVEKTWLQTFEKWGRRFDSLIELNQYYTQHQDEFFQLAQTHMAELTELKQRGEALQKADSRIKEETVFRLVSEILKRGERVLVYAGLKHTCHLPVYAKNSAGSLVYRAFPGKTYSIVLNTTESIAGNENHKRSPAGGAIDRAVKRLGLENIGFDLTTGPPGQLVQPFFYSSIFANAHDTKWLFSDAFDGFIYLVPPRHYRPVEMLPDFFDTASEHYPSVLKRLKDVDHSDKIIDAAKQDGP